MVLADNPVIDTAVKTPIVVPPSTTLLSEVSGEVDVLQTKPLSVIPDASPSVSTVPPAVALAHVIEPAPVVNDKTGGTTATQAPSLSHCALGGAFHQNPAVFKV